MSGALVPGLTAVVQTTVEQADTALSIGSGDVPVLATPRLLALAEAATVAAVSAHLDATETSVGTAVQLRHTRPSPIGTLVQATAELAEVDGKRLVFSVAATDGAGQTIGSGTVERVIVNRERFTSRR